MNVKVDVISVVIVINKNVYVFIVMVDLVLVDLIGLGDVVVVFVEGNG